MAVALRLSKMSKLIGDAEGMWAMTPQSAEAGQRAREKWGVEPKTGDEIEDMLDEVFKKVFGDKW